MNQEPEAGGAVKPASSDAPDAKQTARIAAQAAKLARKPVADEWDKAGDTSGVQVDPGIAAWPSAWTWAAAASRPRPWTSTPAS